MCLLTLLFSRTWCEQFCNIYAARPQTCENNQIVFIDVTADWCATCQFNKLNVLENKKIKSLFKDKNIKLIRADWTKPDKNIDEFLKKYNKFGIPFNAFFSNKYSNGLILPEILNEKNIINILNEIEWKKIYLILKFQLLKMV